MNVAFRVEASVTELRRLLGMADVLALYEVRSEAFERWLAACLAGADVEVAARQRVKRASNASAAGSKS